VTIRQRGTLTYAALGVLTFATYFVICHAISAPTEVMMPAWVPFLPILTIPYLLQVVVSYVLAMAIRDEVRRRAVFAAYFLTMGAIFFVWLKWPTIMNRPPAPEGWWNWPFAVMARADLPVNVAPAGHIVMPVLSCWAFWHDRQHWLRWLVPAQLVGTVGIATTWQHRPVDIVVGAAMATLAGLLFGVGHRAPGPQAT
jgi:hypothetical protein